LVICASLFRQAPIRTDLRSSQKERYPHRDRKEQYTWRGREGSHHFDDDQHPAKQRRRNESPVRTNRPRSETPRRNDRSKRDVREVINTIARPIPLKNVNRGEGKIRRSPSLENQNPKYTTGQVNIIAGGFTRGGCSSSTRKKHVRVIHSVHSVTIKSRPRMLRITFTNDDFTPIDPP